MVNLEFLEFHYFDDILADMKLTPVSVKSLNHNYSVNFYSKILSFPFRGM